MAEKKERQIIDVSSGAKSVKAAPTAARATAAKRPAARKAAAVKPPVETERKAQAVQTHAIVSAQNRSRAKKYRWGAFLLWLLGLGFEVAAILLINGYFYIPGNILTYIIIALVADLICVVCGSQLWKKSNHIDPASEKSKVKFFLWNNMGLIASLICFVPIIIFLLKEKDLDEKTKKIATIIAVIVALIAGASSVDWNPVSAEDLAMAQNEAQEYTVDGKVYWTQFGKCYHLSDECQSLKNSATLYTGYVDEAFEARRSKPCSFCASEEALAQYYDAAESEEILDSADSDRETDNLVDFVMDPAA